ncbi:uncharacterized protein [Ovis canadensis]|uniref:uncharacterized protein n=1 Tax=Ovis canadensis TaxID=37174 RepID=UPI00375213AB
MKIMIPLATANYWSLQSAVHVTLEAWQQGWGSSAVSQFNEIIRFPALKSLWERSREPANPDPVRRRTLRPDRRCCRERETEAKGAAGAHLHTHPLRGRQPGQRPEPPRFETRPSQPGGRIPGVAGSQHLCGGLLGRSGPSSRLLPAWADTSWSSTRGPAPQAASTPLRPFRMKPTQRPSLTLTAASARGPCCRSRAPAPASQRRLLTECDLWTGVSLAVSPRGHFQGWFHMGPSKDHRGKCVSGVPLGNGCTLREASLQRLWAESHRERGCKLKVRVDGAGAAAALAGGQVGTCPPLPVAPPSSTSGSTLRSSSSLPTPTQKPTSNKEDVGTEPPVPPAWGCMASSWLTRHDRPGARTGAGELGDDPSRRARPQLDVGDSTGATRARRWMPGVSRRPSPLP